MDTPSKPAGVKPEPTETLKDVVRELYRENGSPQQAIDKLGVNKTRGYAFANEQCTKDNISFQGIVRLTSHTAPAAAKYLARLAGGVFCAIPEHAATNALAMTAKAVRDQGNAIAEVLTAHREKRLTRARAAKAVKDLDKAICDLASIRQSILATTEHE